MDNQSEKQKETNYSNKIGNKLADDDGGNTEMNNNANKELESLNQLNKKEDNKILLKEKYIELLKNELDISATESKSLLIKNNGDFAKTVEYFLNDFKN
jgi:hypothetical protein